VRFVAEVEDPASLDADLVVACDGVNSRLWRRDPDRFGTRIDTGRNQYMWLSTTRVFDAVLAGDAAHTNHFTIGSGTKLAIEDAIGLASALGAHDYLGPALPAYERERKAALLRLQREARNSTRWFEGKTASDFHNRHG
jgi:2-polyprenyl-6-methoxyphenol hydroxylase-like FAD-dependent oxidoreductase